MSLKPKKLSAVYKFLYAFSIMGNRHVVGCSFGEYAINLKSSNSLQGTKCMLLLMIIEKEHKRLSHANG